MKEVSVAYLFLGFLLNMGYDDSVRRNMSVWGQKL